MGARRAVDKRARTCSNAVRHVYLHILRALTRHPVTHVMEFTDNTAAEHSAERGRPYTERMHTLVSERFHELARLGVHSSVERVASVDNDVADGLSRGGEKLSGESGIGRQ